MARSDARIDVTCDACGQEDVWYPEYVYHDYSGNSGEYDTSDSAFGTWCHENGWTEVNDETFCQCGGHS